MPFLRRFATWALLALAPAVLARAEDVHAVVHVKHEASKIQNDGDVVVWLTPLGRTVSVEPMQNVRLVQKNKRFTPHLLVITKGTSVAFPNRDPFFHNVFSIYKGKRFDLGLYEAGTSRSVQFDRPGVSFIFCNIHPEMSGVVMVLSTPYYAVSNARGDVRIADVPPGRYRMNVWYERSSPEALQMLQRDITVPQQHEVGTLEVSEVVPENAPHKNKYGKDYDNNQPYKP